ncbi:MAG: hypothetical protein EU539_03985 [Promethearchaeota archaeon]|nr:MAG: hypothetical protein EU539_03985 [Candidatus Lokiarchaeota archaeon]
MSTTLTQYDLLNGIFALIFVIISLLVGFRILIKYFTLKKRELITVGLTWIFLSSGWWGAGFSFFLLTIFNYSMNPILYMFLGNIFVPIAIMCWIYSFASMVYTNMKNRIIIIFLVICVSYEVYLISILIFDPNAIGKFLGVFYYQPNIYVLAFQIFAILVSFITGILFSRKSLQSDDPKIRLKGKFLLIAFTAFTLGAIIDSAFAENPITLVIARIILALSAFAYYLGFLLPEKLAESLIRT